MIKKIFKTILGLLLLPVAIGTARAFYTQISDISIFSGILRLIERGVLAYLVFHLLIIRPVYLYVLGHECVHVLATWLCGGHVVSFNVTPSGGNVVTSKTNFFIELSPYFVPLYTIILGFVYVIMKSMEVSVPHMSFIFLFLVGATLAFHFVMTAEVLKLQQPDIAKSGLLFSLIVIFVGNLVVIMAVFSPLFRISFVNFLRESAVNSGELYRVSYQRGMEFVNTYKFW
jgi:hypothetical protein